MVFAPAVASAQPVAYTIEPAHTFVQFEVLHFSTSTIRGRFGGTKAPVGGSVTLDRAARAGQVAIEIDMTGIDTGIAPFNAKLRERDFFDTQRHPRAWFVARQWRFDGDRPASVTGELTLRGVSQGVTLTATHFNCYDSPIFKREVCGGDFEAVVKRSDFGMTYGLPLVGDRVRLVVQVEAVRQ
jgi:polyisoprenoid-binding protein YceI